MKDMTLSVVSVLVLALLLGLAFHSIYPRVNLTGELYSFFIFVAVVLKLSISKLWSLRHKPRAATNTEIDK